VKSRDLRVVLWGGALLLMWDLSGLDLVVTRWFGGPGGFPWRDAWLVSTLLYKGGLVAAAVVLLALVFDTIRPTFAGPTRGQRMRWLVATLTSLLLVPALRSVSATSCPRDLRGFGGVWPYVPHWWFGVSDNGPGHCFPSAHAALAFAFLSLYFLLRDSRPQAARRCLAGVVVAGVLIGGAQLARGAHFPSHTMWSALVCWLVCVAFTVRVPQARRGMLPGPSLPPDP
jgi:membrane-associated PAP2 superfamily phosphatase